MRRRYSVLLRFYSVLLPAYSVLPGKRLFFEGLGMPTTLGELDVDAADIPKMPPTLAQNKGVPFGTFKKLTLEDAEEIYTTVPTVHCLCHLCQAASMSAWTTFVLSRKPKG